MKKLTIYLEDEIVEKLNENEDNVSINRKINDLLRLGLQKQQKMVEMPMDKVIKLLSVIYEKRYKSLDSNEG